MRTIAVMYGRLAMFKINLGDITHTLTESDITALTKKLADYSGADVMILVRDALMERKLQTATHYH